MTRAAGEALAVQMVIGNSPTLPAAITQPVTTLTSQITLDMGNTVFGEPWQDALWTMSLVLLVISSRRSCWSGSSTSGGWACDRQSRLACVDAAREASWPIAPPP